MKDDAERIAIATFIAGQINGLLSGLDADVLEKFLDSKPKNFIWEPTCRLAIKFRREWDALFAQPSTLNSQPPK